MPVALAVAAGGAVGALLRYATHMGVLRAFPGGSAMGTFAVNVVGSFALGVALAYFGAKPSSEVARAFATFGLLGAFTTFSTFSWDAYSLVQEAQYARAAVYIVGSVGIGILALVAGAALGASFGTNVSSTPVGG